MSDPQSPQAALFAALARAQASVGVSGKSGKNDHGRYAYADADDLLSAAKPALEENGLALLPACVKECAPAVGNTSKGKPENRIHLVWTWRLVHEAGGELLLDVIASGHDHGDKAPYKAMTGAQKYALRTVLGIPLREDPEKDAPAAAPQGDQAFRSGQLAAIRALTAPVPHAEWDEPWFMEHLEALGITYDEICFFTLWLNQPHPVAHSRALATELFGFLKSPGGREALEKFRNETRGSK